MVDRKRPVRVAIISPCPPPHAGITRYVENHLEHWDPADVVAHLVPTVVPARPEPPDAAHFHDLLADGQRSWRGVTSYASVLRHAPLTRPGVYRRFLAYNRALSDLVRQEKIDVIYAHGTWPAGASAVLQSRVNGTKSVVVAYGETHGTTPQHRRWARASRFVCRRADAVISTSEHCLRGAGAMGAPPERASVVYAGVNMGEFKPGIDGSSWRKHMGIPADAVVVTVLGLVLRRKLDDFLAAMSSASGPAGAVYVIAGRGPDEEYVRSRAAHLEGMRVLMPGFVPDAELPALYAGTDILVVSPNSELECMGQSMKEAMACGTAVAGARIGGIPEAIEDGVNGLLYEPGQPESLARALSSLASDPGLRERLGRAAAVTAAKRFDARESARKTLDVFRAVIPAGTWNAH